MANLNRQTATITAVGQTRLTTNANYVRTFVFELSGTYVGTVQVQTSIDGTTWRNVTSATAVVNINTGAYVASGNVSVAGVYAVDVSTVMYVRVISTAFTSGTMNLQSIVTENGNLMPSAMPITGAITGTVTANQGTLATGTMYNLVSAATTNAAIVRNAAANLFELTLSNPTATPVFVKFYNKATAPAPATDVPVMTIPVPANSFQNFSFGAQGKRFLTGVGIAVTANGASNDNTAAVAGVLINATYV